MARSNLLNTRTTTFLELVGNGRTHRVPRWQRDYSWEEEQWEDLWNDVLDLRADPADRHYMGAVVVQAQSDRESVIIDGQQRLATLSLLALAVIGRLLDMAASGIQPQDNRERAAGLRARFVGEKDPASLVESSKLLLNETDDAFYQDYLVQLRPPLNPRGLSRSNRLLWDCFRYFTGRLEGLGALDGARLAELLTETVARQLLFILITVEDELNAYTVFETRNARGLELTTTDLLKNYLFSRVAVEADLQALQRRWRSLVAIVRAERFPEFLRYHLLCEQPRVRGERLFKLIRGKARTPGEVFSLMEALERRAELFAALADPAHEYWWERPAARPFVRDLNLFRVRQMTPLLLAAWERMTADGFVGVLRLLTVVTFRYSVIANLNPNALEPVSHRAARAVLDGQATTPAAVFEFLREVYVDDARFEQDFLALSMEPQRKKLARYILARLESDAARRLCDPDTDPGSIEHVLPENPGAGWEDEFPCEQRERNTYRLGNLTLLKASVNRDVGVRPYAEKVPFYIASAYAITRAVVELAPSEWTPALVEERQRRMAARATHLWRAAYA
jgi:hypothetical protein